jgi:hypothetical protein
MRQLHGRAFSVSTLTRDAVVLALALLTGLLIWSTPAHALTQRGHSFASSFGEAFFAEGKKVNPQSGPTAVAVDEASAGEGAGDVYALDSAGNRVVRFGPGPEHEFMEAWGYGVKDGSESYEHCTSECELGIAGHANGQFESPDGIAVDNATGSPSLGDVYVIANRTSGHAAIDKFSPAGKLLDVLLTGKKEEERAEGAALSVAVDQSGTVWVERQEEFEGFRLERFNDAKTNQPVGATTELEVEGIGGIHPARPGFAVNAEGEAYVTYEPGGKTTVELQEEREEITQREKARQSKHEELKNEKVQQPCTLHHCLVAKLALKGLDYHEDETLNASTLTGDLDDENSTGVAIELSSGAPWSNDVYVDNGTSVAAFTSGGSLIQRFGSEQLKGGGGHGLAVDAEANGVFVADSALGRIDVYKPSEPGPPVVETGSVGAAHVTSSSAELLATIDPGGADTHYRFLYGTVSCAATPSSCSEAPERPGDNIGQGFGDQNATEKISGLSPSATYHVLVIAENEFAEGGQAVVSEERTFVTSSSVPAPELPDGREWELVSPSDKHGASVEAIPIEGGLVQASADGRSFTYVTTGPVGENEPEGNRASEQSQILGTREASGWSARDIVTPNERAEGIRVGDPREYLFFSPDFAEALVEPVSAQPLSPQATEQTIYLRHNLTCEAAPTSCYQPLINPVDDTAGTQFGGTKEAFKGATPDLSHVILGSGVPLTASYSEGGLYEWSAGELALISILPKKEPAKGKLSLGGGALDEMHATAISEDGSRVVFRTGEAGPGHLYMRDTETDETLQIDEPNSDAPTPTLESIPDFMTANADGSKVFFTDVQKLTDKSTAPEEPPASSSPRDLYVFEPEKPAGERITDLTPDLNSGESAAVQGEALADENGSIVYFVANGVLANGAEPGNCAYRATGSAGCNLYVEHYNEEAEQWEEPSFIVRLASEDDPDWGRPEGTETAEAGIYNLKNMTSRVSPDGEYLAFMSSRSLTGYDNIDANSGVADEEVYLYKYAPGGTGQTKCVSCEPSGARPVGVYDTKNVGEGIGLVVDRPKIWGTHVEGVDHWLAGNIPGWTSVGLKVSFYQSRYLSDSGRLFFNSADALAPKDVNGKEDVYEYEPAGTGSCEAEVIEGGCVALISSGESQQESAFLDASVNGNDVFFLTNSKLTPDALEASSNVYDARVCGVGGAESCPSVPPTPPAPCGSEACKAAAPAQPTFQTPASSTLTGAGNLVGLGEVLSSKVTHKPKPLTRKQKLAAALKHCRKLTHKQKRVACEKNARKRYGPKKPTAHKGTSKSPQQARA